MGKKSKAIILLGIITLTPFLFSWSASDDEPDNTTTCIKTDQDSTALDTTAVKMQTKSNELNNY